MSTTQDIFEEYADQQGWSPESAVCVLLRYIENQQSNEALKDFLKQQQVEEAGEAIDEAPKPRNKQGINPVTIRNADNTSRLTLARVGFKIGDKPPSNTVSAVLSVGPESADSIVGAATMEETDFISGLGHLFPRGELSQAHLQSEGEDGSA